MVLFQLRCVTISTLILSTSISTTLTSDLRWISQEVSVDHASEVSVDHLASDLRWISQEVSVDHASEVSVDHASAFVDEGGSSIGFSLLQVSAKTYKSLGKVNIQAHARRVVKPAFAAAGGRQSDANYGDDIMLTMALQSLMKIRRHGGSKDITVGETFAWVLVGITILIVVLIFLLFAFSDDRRSYTTAPIKQSQQQSEAAAAALISGITGVTVPDGQCIGQVLGCKPCEIEALKPKHLSGMAVPIASALSLPPPEPTQTQPSCAAVDVPLTSEMPVPVSHPAGTCISGTTRV